MKLFGKGRNPPKKDDKIPPPAAPALPELPARPREISLSTEQESILEKPVDPRVGRILQEIHADKAAAERALKARRIIEFPHGDTGERHVIQDKDGLWRIVPGPAPEQPISLMDGL
jgi:hypothetical protein